MVGEIPDIPISTSLRVHILWLAKATKCVTKESSGHHWCHPMSPITWGHEGEVAVVWWL